MLCLVNVGFQGQILGLFNNVMPGSLGNICGAMQGGMSGFPNNFNNMAKWSPFVANASYATLVNFCIIRGLQHSASTKVNFVNALNVDQFAQGVVHSLLTNINANVAIQAHEHSS